MKGLVGLRTYRLREREFDRDGQRNKWSEFGKQREIKKEGEREGGRYREIEIC